MNSELTHIHMRFIANSGWMIVRYAQQTDRTFRRGWLHVFVWTGGRNQHYRASRTHNIHEPPIELPHIFHWTVKATTSRCQFTVCQSENSIPSDSEVFLTIPHIKLLNSWKKDKFWWKKRNLWKKLYFRTVRSFKIYFKIDAKKDEFICSKPFHQQSVECCISSVKSKSAIESNVEQLWNE